MKFTELQAAVAEALLAGDPTRTIAYVVERKASVCGEWAVEGVSLYEYPLGRGEGEIRFTPLGLLKVAP